MNQYAKDIRCEIEHMTHYDLNEKTRDRLHQLCKLVTNTNCDEIYRDAEQVVNDDKYIPNSVEIKKRKAVLRNMWRTLNNTEIVRIALTFALLIWLFFKYALSDTLPEYNIMIANMTTDSLIGTIIIMSMFIYAIKSNIDYQQSLILLAFDD